MEWHQYAAEMIGRQRQRTETAIGMKRIDIMNEWMASVSRKFTRSASNVYKAIDCLIELSDVWFMVQ